MLSTEVCAIGRPPRGNGSSTKRTRTISKTFHFFNLRNSAHEKKRRFPGLFLPRKKCRSNGAESLLTVTLQSLCAGSSRADCGSPRKSRLLYPARAATLRDGVPRPLAARRCTRFFIQACTDRHDFSLFHHIMRELSKLCFQKLFKRTYFFCVVEDSQGSSNAFCRMSDTLGIRAFEVTL